MRVHITTTDWLSFIVGVLLAPAGGCGGPTEAAPITVQHISVSPATASAQLGDRITLTATVVTNGGTVPPDQILWKAVPTVGLELSPDGLSAGWIAPLPGMYEITVTAGGRQAHSQIAVLTYPSGSPLPGLWRLVSWQFEPEGGAPESVAVEGVYLSVDSLSSSFSVMLPCPSSDRYEDQVAVLSYSSSHADGQHLVLCQQYATSCDTASWALTGSRLDITGPQTGYTLPDGETRRGVSAWEFAR